MRMYKIVGLIFTFLFVVPLITHYFLSNVSLKKTIKTIFLL